MALGEHNLAKLAEAAVERHGDASGVHFEGTWTPGTVNFERISRLSRSIVDLGIEPGDRVAVMMANCPEVAISYVALWRAGAVITPVIFLLPAAELAHVLTDSGARAIITTPEFLPVVRAASADVPTLEHVIVHGGGDETSLSFADLEAGEPGSIVDRADDDLSALMYTGGTTGRSKGVMLTHASLWYAGHAADELVYREGIRKTLVPVPLSHALGLLLTVGGMHAREPSETVLMRWFDPVGWLGLASQHAIQRGQLVPSMFPLLLAQPLEDYDLSSIRYLTCGAAPLPMEHVRELERRLPHLEVLEGYGATETSGIVSVNPPGQRRLGSTGKPLGGLEIRVLDDDNVDVPAGEDGELCIRSPGVMQGYWQAPEATAAAIVDGWFHTGDIGHVDADGYVFIVDRKKDLIIRGGFNVFPREVEDALAEHPEVTAAGVVGKPDEMHGEEVVAFVTLQPESTLTPEEIVAWAKERLGGYKYPRDVRVVEALPLTPVLKLDRKKLRTLL